MVAYALQGADVVVTGTLGLAYPKTKEAFEAAAAAAKEGKTKLLVDVNWRPVFWEVREGCPMKRM